MLPNRMYKLHVQRILQIIGMQYHDSGDIDRGTRSLILTENEMT